MGIYDTYEGIQLKIGDVQMTYFSIGDAVPRPDGIYFGHEGAVAIFKGKLVGSYTDGQYIDKWGERIKVDVDSKNPIREALKEALKSQEPRP